MGTTHTVTVTESRGDDETVATSRCACGWEATTVTRTRSAATVGATGARARHLADVRRRALAQQRASGRESRVGTRAHRELVHGRSLGEPVADGKWWARTVACACGWQTTASYRSAQRAARVALRRHRAHVDQQTDRTPVRDYVLFAVLLVATTLLLLVVVTTAVTGEPPLP